VVKLNFRRYAFVAASGLLVFVTFARWLLWIMPLPHRRLQYMIAGTAATAMALGAVFACEVVRKVTSRRL
jgi:hypothetical protein